MESLIKDIKVLDYLMLPFAILQGREDLVQSLMNENSWIDKEYTLKRIRQYIQENLV